MRRFPRLLVIGIAKEDGAEVCTLALIAALHEAGFLVQHFRSLSAFSPIDLVTPLTGIPSRHLDPWIMNMSLCRELFLHSAAAADISIIEVCQPEPVKENAGDWRELARALNCPVLGVLPIRSLEALHRQSLPECLDALILDGVASRAEFETGKAALQGIMGKPVLGALAGGAYVSGVVARRGGGRRAAESGIEAVAHQLCKFTDLDRLVDLARSRPIAAQPAELFARRARQAVRVAMAYDDCFHCYFPDTLDALEFLGAEICEFSPLRDERLPADIDIVYLGCGHPERFAPALSQNECMRAALRNHVSGGNRVYAEGGGAAYLSQELRLPDGSVYPMVGIFPAQAEITGRTLPRPQPVELKCQRGSWIAEPGQTIRGYRCGAWRLHDRGGLTPCFASESREPEVVARHHCVGSTIHLNFAAHPPVLEAFFAPHAPSLNI